MHIEFEPLSTLIFFCSGCSGANASVAFALAFPLALPAAVFGAMLERGRAVRAHNSWMSSGPQQLLMVMARG